MPAVYISYGFAEGPKIAKKLITELRAAGFQVTDDCAKANVIVAHSLGCFTLQENLKAKTALLIAPSNGFIAESPTRTQLLKVRRDFASARKQKRQRAWFNKSFWNLLYLMGTLGRLPEIIRKAGVRQHTLPAIKAGNVAVIVYRDDPWASALSKTLAKRHPTYTFLSHTSVHDDLWAHPEEYVAVLQYLHET